MKTTSQKAVCVEKAAICFFHGAEKRPELYILGRGHKKHHVSNPFKDEEKAL